MRTNDVCKNFSVKDAVRFLKANDKYVILTHTSPDGDTLGSAYALAYGLLSIGKKAYVICPDKIPEKFNYFVKAIPLPKFKYEKVIAVDIADAKLLGSLESEFAGKIDLNIDHHISNTRYANGLCLDATASANCEIIYEILKKLKVKITDTIAAAIYTGISTDTGSFKYANVTAKTHLITSELYAYNINASEIARKMFDTKSRNRLELERMVLDGAEFHFDDRCMLLTVTSDMQEKTGCDESELEGIAVISRSVEGVCVGVSIKQKDKDTYKVSVRTYPPVNASVICSKLGGGGHINAAGCTVTGSLEEVKSQILSVVKEALEVADAGVNTDK